LRRRAFSSVQQDGSRARVEPLPTAPRAPTRPRSLTARQKARRRGRYSSGKTHLGELASQAPTSRRRPRTSVPASPRLRRECRRARGRQRIRQLRLRDDPRPALWCRAADRTGQPGPLWPGGGFAPIEHPEAEPGEPGERGKQNSSVKSRSRLRPLPPFGPSGSGGRCAATGVRPPKTPLCRTPAPHPPGLPWTMDMFHRGSVAIEHPALVGLLNGWWCAALARDAWGRRSRRAPEHLPHRDGVRPRRGITRLAEDFTSCPSRRICSRLRHRCLPRRTPTRPAPAPPITMGQIRFWHNGGAPLHMSTNCTKPVS